MQRRLVLDAVRSLRTHVTAEQVYRDVYASHPSVSRATVYRNLSNLASDGEIESIGVIGGSAVYDYNCGKHYHFVCEECKRVFDVESYIPGMCDMVAKPDGFEIRGHSLSFTGLCRQCRIAASL